MTDDLEQRCRKAVLQIADDVRDINAKLCHIIQAQHEDYYRGAERYTE